MGPSLKKIATHLKALPAQEYVIPAQAAGIVNYLVDSYFAKIQELNSQVEPKPWAPADPQTHIKELWLNCEVHKMVSLSKTYPGLFKAKIAWAFSKLFDKNYTVVPFVDSYKWKNSVKASYEYRIQQVSLQVGQNEHATLPMYGTFFVSDLTDSKLIVTIDFAHESNQCTVSVMSSPEMKSAAEKFILDLGRSVQQNDIYFKQCLSFERGHIDFTNIRATGWGDIILKPDVIQEIRDNSIGVIDNMDKLSSIGMVPSRNIILISPPGMAKTTIFRAVSDEVQHATRLWCTGKSVQDASDVTLLFEAARSLAPCIVFIEDMDLFGRSRGSLSGYEGHVLNEFLACLDGMHQNSGIVILASTNDIQSMDEALVDRPGRFDVKIEIPKPDTEDRRKMLQSFLKRVHARPDASVTRETLNTVIDMTEGLTGAYIKELANATTIRSVARGGLVEGVVLFNSDDLTKSAEQVLRNYKIGQCSRKKLQAKVELQ